MARRQEERVPLLSDEELPEDELGDIQISFQRPGSSDPALGAGLSLPPSSAEFASLSTGALDGHEDPGRKKKHYSGNEMIVAVFVVQFDIRRGEYFSPKSSYTVSVCVCICV